MVDTNNPQELPEVAGSRSRSVLFQHVYGAVLWPEAVPLAQGILKASIHSIVDHHKLSGLTNAEPLEAKGLYRERTCCRQMGQDGTSRETCSGGHAAPVLCHKYPLRASQAYRLVPAEGGGGLDACRPETL